MIEAIVKRRLMEGSYSYADAVEHLEVLGGYSFFSAHYAVDAMSRGKI